jgi:putative ABC transport system permease protein
VLVPVKAARSYLTITGKLQHRDAGSLVIKIKKGYSTTAAREDIERLLRARRKIQSDNDDDFLVRDLTEFLQTKAAAQKTLGLLLAATAAITLLVGGIGIMNVMLVSVSERTKEIGLRLALGARRSDILWQFFTEALVLCALGCVFGVALGYAGTLGLNEALDWDVESSANIASIAVCAAMATAVVFGFAPAFKAARLNPMQALSKE